VRGDAGSLPLALLFALVVGALTVALLPTVLSQVNDTRNTAGRGHALHAATTGLEVAVAAVRAAYDSSGRGDRGQLPCGPLDGTAGSEAAATYRVELTYFGDDPSRPDASAMNCREAQTGATSPRFVRLVATGTVTSGRPSRRALRGDYPLRVTASTPDPAATWGPEDDDYVHPRAILAWAPPFTSYPEWCLDAGSGRPLKDTPVRVQRCDLGNYQDNGYKQNWYYRQNLAIATVGSILAGAPMCVDAGPGPAAGVPLTMQPCEFPIPARQRWYHNNHYNFELASSTGPGGDDWQLSGLCLNVETIQTSSRLVLGSAGNGNCRSELPNTQQTFGTYSLVGPGQAGSRAVDCTAEAAYPCVLTQVRNHAFPSRCLDKSGAVIGAMECVQHPDLASIRWNQLWRVPAAADGPVGAVGPIVTVDPDGTKYCLTAPVDTTLPSQELCDPGNTTTQRFTVYRNTGDPVTMYRIVDSAGRCLTEPDAQLATLRFYWKSSYNWKFTMTGCGTVDDTDDIFNKRVSILRRQKWNTPFRLPAGNAAAPAATAVGTPPPNIVGGLSLLNLKEIPPNG